MGFLEPVYLIFSLAQIFSVRATQRVAHATVPRSDNRTGVDFKSFQQIMYSSIGCTVNITIKVGLLKNRLQNQSVKKKNLNVSILQTPCSI